ncbi:hypothetical protein B0H14DRAFT_2505983 [Mycena olivaceomarginata]|nr:hypothetical protein B0H14DRAFT_2505983 [Mycena olivaceomarginata]
MCPDKNWAIWVSQNLLYPHINRPPILYQGCLSGGSGCLVVFHLHDLCTPLLFDLWKATGELGALLWYPEIKNMELYLADLEILVNSLLDIWGVIDPNRILVKGKLHVLAHTIDDIRRFGPSVIYATVECDLSIVQYLLEPSFTQP